MAKFKDLSGKYKTSGEASKTCPMGGLCTACMYAYPGNGIIDGKHLHKDRAFIRKALLNTFPDEDPRILEQQLALFWMRINKF